MDLQFKYGNGRFDAFTTNDNQWVGDVSFPLISPDGDRAVVERVFVVPEFRGHGVAKLLMNELIKHARQNELKFRLMCPYAKLYFVKHPEEQDILLPEDRFIDKGE